MFSPSLSALLVVACMASSYGLGPFRGDCKREAKFKRQAEKDKALTGHVIASHDVTSRLACADKCLGNTGCRSYNYQEIGTPLHTCELSSHTKTSMPAAFVSKAGYSYYDAEKFVLPICASLPCQNGGTCIDECQRFHICECKPGYYGENCQTWTGVNGSSQELPSKSCNEAKKYGEDTGDGRYWIDPTGSGNPFQVTCDMTTDGGGWTLVKGIALTTSSPSNNINEASSYRAISNLGMYTILPESGLKALKRDMGFTQIRYYCHKASVGRVFHIMTTNNARGYDAVRYLMENNNPQPKACTSFTRLSDDTSLLAQNCGKWGYVQGATLNNKWGHSGNLGGHRMYNRIAYWDGKRTIQFVKEYKCDDLTGDRSVGDTWKMFVR